MKICFKIEIYKQNHMIQFVIIEKKMFDVPISQFTVGIIQFLSLILTKSL